MTATDAHLSHCSKPRGRAATRIGQRSRFIFCWGWIQTEPLAQTSICQSTCLCGTCSAVVVFCIAIKSYNTGHLFAYFCFSIVFCFKLGAICCEGEERACFSTDSENAAHQYRIFIMLKRIVLTHPPMPFFNW